MGHREYFIRSSTHTLEELGRIIFTEQEKHPDRAYSIQPVKVKFTKEYENEFGTYHIYPGEEFIILSGYESNGIEEMFDHLPKEVVDSINGYNSLDMEPDIYDYAEIKEYNSMDEMLMELAPQKEEQTIANDNILELANILTDQNMQQESEQIKTLLSEIYKMHDEFVAVHKELSIVKEQLMQMQNQPAMEHQSGILSKSTKQFEKNMEQQHKRILGIADRLNKKAGSVIQGFKAVGVKALNGVCSFIGIKESFIELRDISRSNAIAAQATIDKINTVGTEWKRAVTHLKNAGRALIGKEGLPITEEQYKLFEMLKQPYQRKLEISNNRTEKLNKQIEKLDKLEQTASKASVRNKLAENKAAISEHEKLAPQPEKEKPLQKGMAI